MLDIIIGAINAMPDDVRLLIFPLLRIVAAFFGFTLWEDGSVS